MGVSALDLSLRVGCCFGLQEHRVVTETDGATPFGVLSIVLVVLYVVKTAVLWIGVIWVAISGEVEALSPARTALTMVAVATLASASAAKLATAVAAPLGVAIVMSSVPITIAASTAVAVTMR